MALLAVLGSTLGAGCAESIRRTRPADAVTASLDVGGIPIEARVVTKRAEREHGLMGVTALGEREGMLFVYASLRPHGFWMKGCLIPLDVAFLDARGVVLQVDTLQPPTTPGGEPARTRRSPPARYALEVVGGFFARHGLGVGTRVRIPSTVNADRADP